MGSSFFPIILMVKTPFLQNGLQAHSNSTCNINIRRVQPFCRNRQLGCAHLFCSCYPFYTTKWGAQPHPVNPKGDVFVCLRGWLYESEWWLEDVSFHIAWESENLNLGGDFKYFLCSPLFGEDFQFDEHIFQMGWFNHQPETYFYSSLVTTWVFRSRVLKLDHLSGGDRCDPKSLELTFVELKRRSGMSMVLIK